MYYKIIEYGERFKEYKIVEKEKIKRQAEEEASKLVEQEMARATIRAALRRVLSAWHHLKPRAWWVLRMDKQFIVGCPQWPDPFRKVLGPTAATKRPKPAKR